MLLLTQLTYTRLQRGSSGCQIWQTPSELHPSFSDSSCSSKIHSIISIKSVSQIAKTLYTSICLSIHQLDQLFGSSHYISYTWNRYIPAISHHVLHFAACESILTYCALTSGCLYSFPTDTTWLFSTTATNHHFIISCIHLQSFVKKASSPFSHTSTKLLHCWCHKYQGISIQQLTLDVDQPSLSPAYVLTTVHSCAYMTQLCGWTTHPHPAYSNPSHHFSQYPIKCLL